MERAIEDYNPSTETINRLARHEQTTIFRLRTGNCGLRAHLRRIDIMDSALCDCKEAEQTVHHILQDCPIWRKQKHQLWPQDESTTNKLCGTVEDLRRTTQFLATCGLRLYARLIDRRRRRSEMWWTDFSEVGWMHCNEVGWMDCSEVGWMYFSKVRGGRTLIKWVGRTSVR